ncbi:MAG: general stress protein CsbD [Lacibacter sp.]
MEDLKENWSEHKKKLKQKFGFLTDNDFMVVLDKNDDMIRRLQLRLGKTKEELYKIIAAL